MNLSWRHLYSVKTISTLVIWISCDEDFLGSFRLFTRPPRKTTKPASQHAGLLRCSKNALSWSPLQNFLCLHLNSDLDKGVGNVKRSAGIPRASTGFYNRLNYWIGPNAHLGTLIIELHLKVVTSIHEAVTILIALVSLPYQCSETLDTDMTSVKGAFRVWQLHWQVVSTDTDICQIGCKATSQL